MDVQFEWDREKAEGNLKNHGVAFEEALTVFRDPLARIFDDPDHSVEERREIIVGHSDKQRLLLVSFTERSPKVRIISARRATKHEGDEIMSKAAKRNHKRRRDELRPEYRFDYRSSRPNRFAAQLSGDVVAVVLEPDVAEVFHSSKSVNQLLRSVILALPERERRAKRRKAG